MASRNVLGCLSDGYMNINTWLKPTNVITFMQRAKPVQPEAGRMSDDRISLWD